MEYYIKIWLFWAGFFGGFFKVGLPKKPGGFFWVRTWVSKPWFLLPHFQRPHIFARSLGKGLTSTCLGKVAPMWWKNWSLVVAIDPPCCSLCSVHPMIGLLLELRRMSSVSQIHQNAHIAVLNLNRTRCSAIAERSRCRVRYSFRQK